LNPRLTVDIQILQLREGLENDGDDVFPLAVVHGHHLGWKGKRDGTDSSGNMRVIDYRMSEGGYTPHGQVDFVVQSASPFVAEELAGETYLTERGEGVH